jgi:hypothetical protein
VVAAAARMICLLDDPNARTAIASGAEPSPTQESGTARLSVGRYDFNELRDRASRTVGLKNCRTNSISEYDDGTIRGWMLKAKCPGGTKVQMIVDVNGDIRNIEVEE